VSYVQWLSDASEEVTHSHIYIMVKSELVKVYITRKLLIQISSSINKSEIYKDQERPVTQMMLN
jgi:hypothetical protein